MTQTDILFPALATSLIFLSASANCSIKEIDEAGVNLEEFERVHASDGKHNAACIRQRFALAKAYLRAGDHEKAERCFEKALGTARMFWPSIQTTEMLKTEWRLARETIQS
ncbi:MAG: hypothetical protein IPG59_23170 [Candidatus Melainabacteria bacterium]|nr:MAG: hypothetical protein IPG59_23170 [Candidatus Melainabacteria bacterium]